MAPIIFSGKAFGVSFLNRKASSPQELAEQLFPNAEDGMRCWVLVKTHTGEFWMETPLNIPIIFDSMRHLLDEEVIITFRSKNSISPNTSPDDTSPAKEAGDTAGETVTTADDVQSLLAKSSIDGSISEVSDGPEVQVLNDVDPFTDESISSLSDVLHLQFRVPGTIKLETLAVSLEAFEQFTQHAHKEGEDIVKLEIKRVKCRNNGERNFRLTAVVWAQSILEYSRSLRSLYFQVTTTALSREAQLNELKTDLPDLWARVLYWISDLLAFSEAESRLIVPAADGAAPFMSLFYFDEDEAKFLGDTMLPNLKNVDETMRSMLEAKAGSGATEVCASHDIAPFLQEAFQTPHNFHKEAKFKKAKSKWIKKREKEMAKKSQTA